MHQAEIELAVLSAQTGEREAFDKLARHFNPPLLRFAFKIAKDRQLAEDAVQESWFKVFSNIKRIDDPRSFTSWIYKIVRWRVIDGLRVKQRKQSLQSEMNDQLVGDSTLVSADDNGLSKAIKALPAIEHQVIHLFYLDELSTQDIAVILEIPVGTVKSRLSRARSLLKSKLTE